MATSRRRNVGHPAPLSSSQSLPQLQSSGSDAASSAGTKCRGEFCRVAPAALPGLYDDSAEQENDGDSDEHGGQLIAAKDRGLVLPDDGQRYKISNNNLLLARAEMGFLLGEAAVKPGDDVALLWQEADNVHRTELGRSNPTAYYKQVSVCRNCHRIYSDLASFRELGFRSQRTAWGSAEMDKAKKNTTKNKKSTGREKRQADKSMRALSPEDDGSAFYDQLFLAELAKHSDGSDEVTNSQQSTPSARSESDQNSQHRSIKAPTESLPALAPSIKQASTSGGPVKPRKATSPQLEESALSNQQNAPQSVIRQHVNDLTSIQQLEKTIQFLRDELSREQSKCISFENQRTLLEQKLAQAQLTMQDKEDGFRKKLLEVELEAVGKQMNSSTTRDDANPGSTSASEVTELIETIDSLNAQLDQANSERDKMRRDLLHNHQVEVKRLHEKYQIEMETLRLSEHTAKEQAEAAHMQMTHWQSEAQVSLSQAKSAKAALDELTKSKLPLLEEKNQRLQRQLTEQKAKAQLVSSAASTSTSAQDPVAIEKHLNNKIEYLKAQVASEMKCKEELGSHLAQVTASLELLKKEKRTALLEQVEAHKRHLERVESNFTQEKEVLTAQLASLQGKIAMLQANITDLVQELTVWKSREANSKLSIEKLAEENVRLTRQIVDLEGHIENLQEERKREGIVSAKNATEETQRVQMEALLRRLDNERQYLKNQVDHEAELKAQSQRQVQELTHELQELKISTEELTKLAEHKLSTLSAEKANIERQLRDEKAALEEGKVMLTRQLKDVQVKFMQAREQSLVEKDELEKVRIELNEAKSQLISAREEAVKEKEYGKASSERMSKALVTIKGSLKAMEEEKNLRVRRLEEENGMFMQRLAKAQGELLVLENKTTEDKHGLRRYHALLRLLHITSQKLEVRHMACKANVFSKLQCISSAKASIDKLQQVHEATVSELEERLRREFMDKCDELTQRLSIEREASLSESAKLFEREKTELQQYYEQEKSQLEEDLRHLHTRQMQELEEQYERTIKSIDEQSAATLGVLQNRCEELQEERDEARAAFAETRARCEQIGAMTEAQRDAALAEFRQKEEKWVVERNAMSDHYEEIVQKMKDEMRQLEERLREDHDSVLRQQLGELASHHSDELNNLRQQLIAEAASKEQTIRDDHNSELAALQRQYESDLDRERHDFTCRLQRELERERVAHDQKLNEALDRAESKTQGHFDTMQKEMNDRKATALLQCTAKWQRAMEELQGRLEVEKKTAYESGIQDRENEWQQAALQIKQKQKEELESVQKEALKAISAAEERHRMLLEAQTAQLRKDFEERLKHSKEQHKREVVEAEETKHRSELARALKEQEELLFQRHRNDLQNALEELVDDHRADVTRLEDSHKTKQEALAREYQARQEELTSQLEGELNMKAEELRKERETAVDDALSQQRKQLLIEFESERREMQSVFNNELSAKVKELEERLTNEQEEAIGQVQEDSERLIERVEVAMNELKKQKEALESELTRLRAALEEAEDAHFDTEERTRKQQKLMAFQQLSLIMHAKKAMEKAQHAHTGQLMELQAKHDQLDTSIQREKRQWDHDLAQVRESWSQLQSRHNEMMKTLTNYKRDELVAHRSASSVLSNEITIVTKQMDEVSEMKKALEKEIEQLHSEAQNVEASLRQLMLQSSTNVSSSSHSGGTDGGLNMAVVAKKRRLNEEFEALLEQIEKKKAEVRNIDKTLASLRQRKEEKEVDLKAMERKLVEILVGQQKQMLTLLTATRETPVPSILAASAVSAG